MTTVNEKTEVEVQTHTLGPWHTSRDGAHMMVRGDDETIMKLIAAAPDLLHACKFADTVLAFLDEKGGKWDDLRKCLSAAITKATVGK